MDENSWLGETLGGRGFRMVVGARGRAASTLVVYASLAAVVTSVPLTTLRIERRAPCAPFVLEQRAITSRHL